MEFYGLWGEIGGKIHSPNLPSQRDGKMEFWETGKEKRLDPNWNKFIPQNSLFIFPIPAQAPKFPLNSDFFFFVGMRGKKLCQGVLILKSPRGSTEMLKISPVLAGNPGGFLAGLLRVPIPEKSGNERLEKPQIQP